jgi:hypothetical protein
VGGCSRRSTRLSARGNSSCPPHRKSSLCPGLLDVWQSSTLPAGSRSPAADLLPRIQVYPGHPDYSDAHPSAISAWVLTSLTTSSSANVPKVVCAGMPGAAVEQTHTREDETYDAIGTQKFMSELVPSGSGYSSSLLFSDYSLFAPCYMHTRSRGSASASFFCAEREPTTGVGPQQAGRSGELRYPAMRAAPIGCNLQRQVPCFTATRLPCACRSERGRSLHW